MKLILLLLLSFVSLTIKSQTYYIVRHAEKQSSSAGMTSTDNPPLTDAGLQRARVLKDFLKDKKIGYIFSTNTLRTISTVKPLSELTGIKISMYQKPDRMFIDTLLSLQKNTLIVGHSNTVDDIVNKLCEAEHIHGDLPDSQYDNLYIVTVKGKMVSYYAIKYGKVSQ